MNENIQDFFKLAMDRKLPEIKPMPIDPWYQVLNVGSGNKIILGAINIDYPEWDAETMPLPYKDESIDAIHCYHFLEHISDPIKVLKEFQRVLKTGGHVNICVPYYASAMAHHDLDHKKFFTEDTWKNTFSNPYYDKGKTGWQFEIGFNLICGIVERNLCLLTQLVKVQDAE